MHSTHRRVLVPSSTGFSRWGCAALGCSGQRQRWWQQQREGGGLGTAALLAESAGG